MISVEQIDKVAHLKLDHGVTNPINLALVNELDATLRRLERDNGVNALVLGSANSKFFSIGFDIPSLYRLSKDEFTTFYQGFNRLCLELFTFPKPTVAAISGHAIAGGCILALCCDYRYISEGHKLMGLNEIKLGVPVPYPADCILRQLVGARQARDILDLGEFYPPGVSFDIGMVDQVFPIEEVVPAAIERAQSLGALPQEAYTMIKRNRVETVSRQIQANLAEKERLFTELWYRQDTRERLKTAMEKF